MASEGRTVPRFQFGSNISRSLSVQQQQQLVDRKVKKDVRAVKKDVRAVKKDVRAVKKDVRKPKKMVEQQKRGSSSQNFCDREMSHHIFFAFLLLLALFVSFF